MSTCGKAYISASDARQALGAAALDFAVLHRHCELNEKHEGDCGPAATVEHAEPARGCDPWRRHTEPGPGDDNTGGCLEMVGDSYCPCNLEAPAEPGPTKPATCTCGTGYRIGETLVHLQGCPASPAAPAPSSGARSRAHALLQGSVQGILCGSACGPICDRLTANEEAHDRALRETNARAAQLRENYAASLGNSNETISRLIAERDALKGKLEESEERIDALIVDRTDWQARAENAESAHTEAIRVMRGSEARAERLTKDVETLRGLLARSHATTKHFNPCACVTCEDVRAALTPDTAVVPGEAKP